MLSQAMQILAFLASLVFQVSQPLPKATEVKNANIAVIPADIFQGIGGMGKDKNIAVWVRQSASFGARYTFWQSLFIVLLIKGGQPQQWPLI